MARHQSRLREAEGEKSRQSGSAMAAVPQWATQHVEEQPLSTMCAAFAAGFVIGAGAVAAYCAATQEAQLSYTDRMTARISDALNRTLPDMINQHLPKRFADWRS